MVTVARRLQRFVERVLVLGQERLVVGLGALLGGLDRAPPLVVLVVDQSLPLVRPALLRVAELRLQLRLVDTQLVQVLCDVTHSRYMYFIHCRFMQF